MNNSSSFSERFSNPDRIYEKSSQNQYLKEGKGQVRANSYSAGSNSEDTATSDDQVSNTDKLTLNSECECDNDGGGRGAAATRLLNTKTELNKRNTIATTVPEKIYARQLNQTQQNYHYNSANQHIHHLSSSDTGIECLPEINDEWFYINKGDIFQVTHTHYKKSRKNGAR